jgi:acyl carrier protein
MLGENAEAEARWIGVEPLAASHYLTLLGKLLATNANGPVLALEANWARLYASYSQRSPMLLFSELYSSHEDVPAEARKQVRPSPEQSQVNAVIRAAFAELLGYQGSEEIDDARGFFDQGMDSLLAIRFTEMLHERLDVRLRTTDLFNYNSVLKLTEFVARSAGVQQETGPVSLSAPAPAPGKPVAQNAAWTDQLSALQLIDVLGEMEHALAGEGR